MATDSRKERHQEISSETDASEHGSLEEAIARLQSSQRVSFHMPGHKSRMSPVDACGLDVTELPGLDDLACPAGPIAAIERRLAEINRVSASLLTVNGASSAIMAGLLALADRGSFVFAPANAHRSVVNGIVLAGLEVRWYEPDWSPEWGIFGGASPASIHDLLSTSELSGCAGLVLVSPTFAGAVSDVEAIARICHLFELPLVVDEAHGAHFYAGPAAHFPVSACALGADLVAHSLHKTLTGLTQTGVLHLPAGSSMDAEALRASLRLISSTSPSYPLMCSAERTAREGGLECNLERFAGLAAGCLSLKESMTGSSSLCVYESGFLDDPWHLLIGCRQGNPAALRAHLKRSGIVPEAELGRGILLLAGAGTETGDLEYLAEVLNSFDGEGGQEERYEKPPLPLQEMSPRKAFFAPSEQVPVHQAAGRLAAECLAPCPPGIPLCVPGARITSSVKKLASMVDKVRVVRE
ncbi:MAG: aminotransferase class I/II-fold pyridoxal phosphate-dependent enzyme [Candidatus Melainabacteria bacterium]|nr:aminotransferase class I/II-fold pyridoxal phosphate-dependent enzyme [Candidatus Melainabacteria bacterium]